MEVVLARVARLSTSHGELARGDDATRFLQRIFSPLYADDALPVARTSESWPDPHDVSYSRGNRCCGRPVEVPNGGRLGNRRLKTNLRVGSVRPSPVAANDPNIALGQARD